MITSGTLSPIDMYPRILGFQPRAVHSFSMSFSRNVICPLVVTRGADQVPLCSKFDTRSDAATIRNYGKLLVETAAAVPDVWCAGPSWPCISAYKGIHKNTIFLRFRRKMLM